MSELTVNENAELSTERPIEVITEEINFYKATAGTAILEIGKRLIEAKALLNHGEWGEWLEQKVDFSEVTAQRFMRLAKEYSNPSPVTVLGASKALILLALPGSERDEFMSEKHTVNGVEKSVDEMSKRELEKAVKERNEALKREADISKRLEELTDELERVKESEAEGDALLEKAQAEIEELKKAKEPLPVEVSDEQMAEIRSKIEAETKEQADRLRDKIEKLKKKNEQAAEEKKKITEQMEAIKAECERISKNGIEERQNFEKEIDALKAKITVAGSASITEFKVYFNDLQNLGNKILECISKTQAQNAEEAGKLRGVSSALLEKLLEAVKG